MAEAKMFLCAKAGHVDKNEKKTRPFILFFFPAVFSASRWACWRIRPKRKSWRLLGILSEGKLHELARTFAQNESAASETKR